MSDKNIAKLIMSLSDPELIRRNIIKDYEKAKNVNSKVCAECGGECCYEWMLHQKIICELINYFKDKDFPCSI